MIREDPKVRTLALQPTFTSTLSLLNPHDYVTLFYWYWYYPQAVDDYIVWIANQDAPQTSTLTAPEPRQTLSNPSHSATEPLFWQAAILGQLSLWCAIVVYSIAERLLRGVAAEGGTLLVGIVVGSVLYTACVSFSYTLAKAGLTDSPYNQLLRQVYYPVAFTFLLTIPWISPATVTNSWMVSVYVGSALGLILGVSDLLLAELDESPNLDLMIRVFLGVLAVLAMSFLARFVLAATEVIITGSVDLVLNVILFISTVLATWGFIFFRPDDWVFGYLFGDRKPNEAGEWELPHVTRLPLLRVTNTLETQFKNDWKVALGNALSLRRYSRQEAYIVAKIREQFTEKEDKKEGKKAREKIVENVLHLFMNLRGHEDALKFAPNSDKGFKKMKRRDFTKELSNVWKRINETEDTQAKRSPILKRPSDPFTLHFDKVEDEIIGRAAIAGFWHLHRRQPKASKAAFEKLMGMGSLGKELSAIANILDDILDSPYKVIPTAPLNLEEDSRPKERKFKEAWGALDEIRDFVRCGWVFQRCNETERRIAIGQQSTIHLNEALTKLRPIVESDEFSPIEDMLLEQVEHWLSKIDAYHAPNITKLKKDDHPNPYKFVEPLSSDKGSAYQLRADVDSVFDQAWISGNFQPVLLYGQRQIGKTSIILIEREKRKNDREVIYVNMQHLDTHATHAHLLMAICDEIEKQITAGGKPDESTLFRAPYYTFRSYINSLGRTHAPVVIAIDEFEHIESLTAYTDTHDNILNFLWELAQIESQLGFAFLTHKTPKEILNEYNNPFSTGLSPIHISYLSEKNVHGLLRNPTKEFLPYCTNEAINTIYRKTNGHPFLVQLWGYCLVEHFRENIKNSVDPLFTKAEAISIEKEDNTFKRGLDHYGTNIWHEVAANDLACAHVLYQISRREYITYPKAGELQKINEYPRAILHLKNHDIISQDPEAKFWKITVPLLRDWCCEKLKPDGSLPDFTFRGSAPS